MAQNRTSTGVVGWGGLLLVGVAGIAFIVMPGTESDPPPPRPTRLTRALPVPPAAIVEDSPELPIAADRVLPTWPVEPGTLAGSKAAPVVAGTSIAFVERYLAPQPAAAGGDRQSELIAAGVVVVFDAETPVEAIRLPEGKFTILRPTDGPHKGKTLVARDADVRRS